MYFATQLFSLSVISRKNWLSDLGSMWQDMFISDKNNFKSNNLSNSFRKKKLVKRGTELIETMLAGDSLYLIMWVSF